MPSFHSLGVSPAIADRLAERGITEPFPIQAATLADALAGKDVCGRAPTGSGKTIAFGIPLVERVGKARPYRPQGLVLVPTRELATQVADELYALGGHKGPSIVTIFGGVGFGPQLAKLRKGADIAVACPGRLMDLINQGNLQLDDVGFVVLDEADRMADMGFLPEVKRILDQVRTDRQTLLFSATLDGAVDELVKKYQRKPARHEHAADEDAPQSEHLFWKAEKGIRVDLTAEVIKKQWPAVVFVRTRHGADRLADRLDKLGVSAAAIHGDRSQAQRERALDQFATGRVQALVATDVAARGIHVDDVACVVHFDPPQDEKDYVHRSGRTGRAGTTGLVISMVPGDRIGHVRRMIKILGRTETIVNADVEGLAFAEPPAPKPPKPAKAPTVSDLNRGPKAKRYDSRGPKGKGSSYRGDRDRDRDDRPRRDGEWTPKPKGKTYGKPGERTERTERADRGDRYERAERPAPKGEWTPKPRKARPTDRNATPEREWSPKPRKARPTDRTATPEREWAPTPKGKGGKPGERRTAAAAPAAGAPRKARPVKAAAKNRKRNAGGQIGANHRGRRPAPTRNS